VLRWWQRESLRTLVEHASTVVPPTMLALESAAGGSQREVESSAAARAQDCADDSARSAESMSTTDVDSETLPDTDEAEVPPPTDLSEHRRRLLVAGLTRVRP